MRLCPKWRPQRSTSCCRGWWRPVTLASCSSSATCVCATSGPSPPHRVRTASPPVPSLIPLSLPSSPCPFPHSLSLPSQRGNGLLFVIAFQFSGAYNFLKVHIVVEKFLCVMCQYIMYMYMYKHIIVNSSYHVRILKHTMSCIWVRGA